MANQNVGARKLWRNFIATLSTEQAAVAKAVISQLGGVNAEALEELNNVAQSSCGAAGGYSGFVYYTETVAFWRKNRAKITALMDYECEAIGCWPNALDMVLSFNYIKTRYNAAEVGRAIYGRFDSDLTGIYNTLSWYALEETAYRYSEYLYESNNE